MLYRRSLTAVATGCCRRCYGLSTLATTAKNPLGRFQHNYNCDLQASSIISISSYNYNYNYNYNYCTRYDYEYFYYYSLGYIVGSTSKDSSPCIPNTHSPTT